MKFSYVMLPGLPARRLDRDDQDARTSSASTPATRSTRPGTRTCGCSSPPRRDKTKNIRFGPNLTPIGLREPTLICQALATLDELTGGRTECVFSIGNFGLLAPVRDRLGEDQAPLAREGGAPCDAHVPRRRARSPSRASSTSTPASSPSRARCRSGCRSSSAPCAARSPSRLAGEISDGCHHAL